MTPSERLPFHRVHHCPIQGVCIITLMTLSLSVPSIYRYCSPFSNCAVLNIYPTASMSMMDCDMINRGGISTEQTKGCLTTSESVLPSALWCDDHRLSNSCCNLQSIHPLQLAIVQQTMWMLDMHHRLHFSAHKYSKIRLKIRFIRFIQFHI